jgi:hypothetical protein
MLWFFKNYFCQKKSAKKLPFWTQNKAKLWKKLDHNIGFWEKRQFFRRKLAKIAEHYDYNIDRIATSKTRQKGDYISVSFLILLLESWVHIQKPVVPNLLSCKSSVTSCAGLPNWFLNIFILQFRYFLKLPSYDSICSQLLHFQIIKNFCKYDCNFIIKNIWYCI